MLVTALLGATGSAYLAVRGVIVTMANVSQPQLVALAGRLAARIAGTTPMPPPAAPSTIPGLPPGS
jgi:hypothetical protein